MLYFPILWILSIAAYGLFFLLFHNAEKKHNIKFEWFSVNYFPGLKNVRELINTSTEPKKIRDFRMAILCLYLSRILFATPLLIYFILALTERIR
jgi:hypothetical protein